MLNRVKPISESSPYEPQIASMTLAPHSGGKKPSGSPDHWALLNHVAGTWHKGNAYSVRQLMSDSRFGAIVTINAFVFSKSPSWPLSSLFLSSTGHQRWLTKPRCCRSMSSTIVYAPKAIGFLPAASQHPSKVS